MRLVRASYFEGGRHTFNKSKSSSGHVHRTAKLSRFSAHLNVRFAPHRSKLGCTTQCSAQNLISSVFGRIWLAGFPFRISCVPGATSTPTVRSTIARRVAAGGPLLVALRRMLTACTRVPRLSPRRTASIAETALRCAVSLVSSFQHLPPRAPFHQTICAQSSWNAIGFKNVCALPCFLHFKSLPCLRPNPFLHSSTAIVKTSAHI